VGRAACQWTDKAVKQGLTPYGLSPGTIHRLLQRAR